MTEDQITDLLRDIKKELRANMNGIASSYMREHGAAYRINFGIELPRLTNIAREFPHDHSLAQRLWHEQVRESRILAAMLMPTDRFDESLCDLWAEEVNNTEIAQTTVFYLFSRLPYAGSKAFEWMASTQRPLIQLMGFLLITRLIIQGAGLTQRDRNEVIDQAQATLASSPSLALHKAAQAALNRVEEMPVADL